MGIYFAVALGSAIGGLARFAISVAFAERLPWPTLAINVLGSTIIGIALAITVADGRFPLTPIWRALIMPGFCGGFTTFSTFSAEAFTLWQDSHPKAILYVMASLILSIAGVWTGHSIGEKYN